jgi:hypothetical protein
MIHDPKLRFALAIVLGRLHTAHGDKRCGCGPCAHWVATAARRAGVPRARLEAALPPAAKPEPPQRRRPRAMQTRICESGTIRPRGQDTDPQAGLTALLSRLHHSA